MGMELHFLPRRHVGERGTGVQQKNQRGALPQRMSDLASPDHAPRFVKEGLGKLRAVDRHRTRHDAIPFARERSWPDNQNRIIPQAPETGQPYKDL
jgi:hypothetical protein